MTYAGRVEAQFSVPSGQTLIATNGGAPKTVAVPQSSYYLTDFLALLQSQLNTYSDSAAWTLALDTTASGTGKVTVNCTATFSLTLTAELASLLGVNSFAGVTTPQLGTNGPNGVWFPDASLNLDGDPDVAPVMTDLRATRGPTGKVVGLGGGNRSFQHSNVLWKTVPKTHVWTSLETTTNNSWQTFVTTTQHGQGTAPCASWFAELALVQIYGLRGARLGTNLANGWSMLGVDTIAPKLSLNWTAYYDIVVPTVVSRTT